MEHAGDCVPYIRMYAIHKNGNFRKSSMFGEKKERITLIGNAN